MFLRTAQARSAEAALLQRLAHGWFEGDVHSVFEKAVNIRCAESDELITLVAAAMDNGPNTIVLELAHFADTGIEIGDHVSAAADVLSIDRKLNVLLTGAAAWRQPRRARLCTDDQLRERLATVLRELEKRGAVGGMVADPTRSAVSRRTSDKLHHLSEMLVAALKRDDLAAALDAARQIIGLGPGLTPSGDDFLVGLLLAIGVAPTPQPWFETFRAAAVEMSKSATNAISHMAIRKAAEGEARESIGRLLRELLGRDQTGLLPALDDVLAIGFSSGTDIAWGLVRGLDVVLTVNGGDACGRS